MERSPPAAPHGAAVGKVPLSGTPSAHADTATTRFIGKCQYKTGKCFKERTLKRNGQAHSLCEEHRVKQNLIQRRSDRKYQSLHAVRRKERSQMKAMLKKQVTMAVAQQMYLEHHQHKILNPLVFHNPTLATAAIPAAHPPPPTTTSHTALPVGYHGMLPPAPPSLLLCGLPKSAYDSPAVHKNTKQAIPHRGISPLGTATTTVTHHHDKSSKDGTAVTEERSWKHALVDDPTEPHQHENMNVPVPTVDAWTDDDVQLLQSILLV
ncbi:hypothetical protein DYB32_008766 [Aphanomyces invadans]|uniref:Uncharacterized protein n=1 Tax=Aphanomyces invadans TaxID=157072 RepID=A0A418AU68_9STRA|nr:hypothetical protein DYB32_008766 [Aphanomyces invadans]